MPPVGREEELTRLHAWLTRACSGVRQVVFVTGEAGLGKTTLVEAFVAQLGPYGPLWIGRGQCVEHYGSGEPYLPVLEALGRLCRGPGGQELVALLEQQAPTWLVQMPGLVQGAALETLQHRIGGATRERMLRELAEALDLLTAQQPLVLVLEDLHWSDPSTLDLLAVLARRREPARLFLLGTYRPPVVLRRAHPLHTVTQELQLHGHSVELPLPFLPEDAVAAYLTSRVPGLSQIDQLVRLVSQRTEGNPLFMVTLVESWLSQGLLMEQAGAWALPAGVALLHDGIPESLRQLIDMQLDRLSAEEQRVLEAASVAGVEFSAAVVAAGLAEEVAGVDDCCTSLARRAQFLAARGEQPWPDGTVAGGYRFVHTLYQQVCYHRVSAAQRVRLHQRVGARLEAGYGPQARERAAELAVHFVRGRAPARAAPYLQVAGAQAMARSAHREAVMQYEQALQMLQHVPQTPETITQAIDSHLALRTALIPLGETPAIFLHMQAAEALAEQGGDRVRQGQIAAYWTRDYGVAGHHEKAVAYGQRALTLIDDNRALRMTTQLYLSYAYRSLGDYQAAVTLLTDALASLAMLPAQTRLGAALPAVVLRHSMVLCLTELGQFAAGIRYGQEAVHMAEATGHLFSLHQARRSLANLYVCQGAFARALPLLERARILCQEADLPYGLPYLASLLGYAYAQVGRVADAVAGLEEGRQLAAAAHTDSAYAMLLILLGDGYVAVSRVATAVALAQEALVTAQARHERGVQGHALRLLGDLAAGDAAPDIARAAQYYQHALALADELGMRPLQAHCHRGLGTLYAATGQREQARMELAAAIAMYRAMEMPFWLPQAETALAQVEGR